MLMKKLFAILTITLCTQFNLNAQNTLYDADSAALKIIEKNIEYPTQELADQDKESIVLAKVYLNKKGLIDSVITWNKSAFAQGVKDVLYLTNGKWAKKIHRKNQPILIPFLFKMIDVFVNPINHNLENLELWRSNLWQAATAEKCILYKPILVVGIPSGADVFP